jgi:hypothetical protein
MAKKVAKAKAPKQKSGKTKAARRPRASKQESVQCTLSNPEENNDPMTELLTALTNLANEATIYLAKKNGTLGEKLSDAAAPESAAAAAEVVAAEGAVAAGEAAAPAKRGRRTKAEIAADKAAAEAAEDPLASLGLPSDKPVEKAPAPKPLTDAESMKLLIDTATEYLTKFGKVEGSKKAKALLKPYKGAEKITDLAHADRLTYVETLKKELA